MRGLAILLGFNLLGIGLQKLAGAPLPGNVIGLILFTACLFAGAIKVQWVEDAATFLLQNMLLFFAPVIVGTIVFFEQLRGEWLAVIVGLVGSWLAVILLTGWTASVLIGKEGRRDE